VTRVEHRRVATGGRDDWRTPDGVLCAVRDVAPIVVDPCASSDRSHWFGVHNLTDAEDGMSLEWTSLVANGLAFVNWPYSKSAAWADKVITEAKLGCPIVVLCGARPGARWYRKAVSHADAVAEWRGRIRFVGAAHSAPFPSALLAYNLSWRRFAAAFAAVADTYVPRAATALTPDPEAA
jgi:hypothetical protein